MRSAEEILCLIAGGRTDAIVDLFEHAGWQKLLGEGQIKPMQWLVYYGDVTAMKLVLREGGDLSSIDLDAELGNAAFFGHWAMCDFLLLHGADATYVDPTTGETALHSALSKAGRPHYNRVVRLLLENGANPNAPTIPDCETGAFMRDVRTKGETPLHRAAAFADAEAIQLLLDHGADKKAHDIVGDTPLSWASWHLRPGDVLQLLAYGEHRISDAHVARNTSDHGAGWGNSMERNLLGDFLRESGN